MMAGSGFVLPVDDTRLSLWQKTIGDAAPHDVTRSHRAEDGLAIHQSCRVSPSDRTTLLETSRFFAEESTGGPDRNESKRE
jgi:hypothetical protein